MRIKRYEGQYVHEVIADIRAELGADAVVLHTRWRNPGGLQKLLKKPYVEVWAGAREEVEDVLDQNAEPHAARALALRQALEAQLAETEPTAEPEPALAGGRANGQANGKSRPDSSAPAARFRSLDEPADAEAILPDSAPTDPTLALLTEFNQALARLESKVDHITAPPAQKAAGLDSPRFRALLDSGIDRHVAEEIAAAAEQRTIAEVLLETFQISRELDLREGPKVVAVIGPSGVGKTTTIAKLAGHYGLARGARVLLATTDTQRVGNFEQIKALGQLMQMPTSSFRSAAEAQAKLQVARQAHDLILVDTSACTPRSGDEWDRLLDTLIAIEPDEIHVVVSATMKTRDAAQAIELFRQSLPLTGCVVTKLDEASEPGLLVDLAWRCLMPLSWLGTGHDIPGDLERPTAEDLLRRVWSPRLDAPLEEVSDDDPS